MNHLGKPHTKLSESFKNLKEMINSFKNTYKSIPEQAPRLEIFHDILVGVVFVSIKVGSHALKIVGEIGIIVNHNMAYPHEKPESITKLVNIAFKYLDRCAKRLNENDRIIKELTRIFGTHPEGLGEEKTENEIVQFLLEQEKSHSSLKRKMDVIKDFTYRELNRPQYEEADKSNREYIDSERLMLTDFTDWKGARYNVSIVKSTAITL